LPQPAKEALFADPEGFSSLFTATISSVLSDHIADRLECIVTGSNGYDVDEFFPREVQFVQRELVDAGQHGLYDKVQRDSGVEENFIGRLRDDERVVCFFKFPPKFLVRLPRLIGDYNPDWGIVRRDNGGILTLHLVRETKGNIDLDRLQFPQEKRKIVCATKYFGAAAIDYRVVTDETVRWWESRPVEAVQQKLRLD
jgi:type III restriction enzyme